MHEPYMSHSLVRTSLLYTSPFCGLPVVPRIFCPLDVELHINQVGTSRMSPDSPPSPRHFWGIPTDHQIPFCVLLLSVFLVPKQWSIIFAIISCRSVQRARVCLNIHRSVCWAQIYTCSFALLEALFFEMLAVTVTFFNFEDLILIQSSLSR